MSGISVPTREQVLEFGSKHNPVVWDKHGRALGNSELLNQVLDDCSAAGEFFQTKARG